MEYHARAYGVHGFLSKPSGGDAGTIQADAHEDGQGMNHWLIKSEPDVFSIGDLARCPQRTTHWDGVRNYQARNHLRAMRVGDRALFYHSNADPPAVVGIVEVVHEARPDPSAWDPNSATHDPKASPKNPVWSMVDVRLVEALPRAVPLDELRGVTALAGMELLRRGSRLSVQPVAAAEFRTILKLAARPVRGLAAAAAKRPRGRT